MVYITVGTGVGAAALVDGVPVHGLMHPEIGHIRAPRAPDDDYPGSCPYGGDCVEGGAAGPSIIARWGAQLGDLPAGHVAFEQTAHYLSHLVASTLLFLVPGKIFMGGGVMSNSSLLPMIRDQARTLLNGYIGVPEIEHDIDRLIVPPGLADNAGVPGAIAMASSMTSAIATDMPERTPTADR